MNRKQSTSSCARVESFFASREREPEDIHDLENWEAADLSIGESIESLHNPCRRYSVISGNRPIECATQPSTKTATRPGKDCNNGKRRDRHTAESVVCHR